MNKKIVRQLTIVFLIGIHLGSPIHGQSDSLTVWIDKVEQILFAEGDDNCYLYEFMECKRIHKPVYDSFQVVNCYQPDAYMVKPLLEKILWTKDPSEYTRLLEIYRRYMELFLDQFEQVIRDNYYQCKFIKGRWSIASNFEMLLISLEFKKKGWSDLRIYNYYKNEWIKNKSKFRDLSQFDKIIDTFQYRFILADFKTLHPYAPQFRHNHTFHYIDPYVPNIETCFLNDLYKCNLCFRDQKGRIEWECSFISNKMHFLNYYKSDSVEQYFVENFQCWTSEDYVDRRLVDYIIYSENVKLMSLASDKFLKRTSETGKDYYLQDFLGRTLSIPEFFPLVMDKIIKIGEEDLEFTKNRLSYIPMQYREEAKKYIKHNAPKESKLYQELSRGEKE